MAHQEPHTIRELKTNETLLDIVRRDGPVTTEAVATRYGWSRPYAFKQLDALVAEGLLERLPGIGSSGRYNVWRAV